jgi:hypothetical protein
MRTHQQPRVRKSTVVLVIGLLIALLGIGLTACGYSSASIASTFSQTQVQSQAQTQVDTKVKKCGIVQVSGRLEVPVNDTGAAVAENCFLQAFRVCQPAILVYIIGSVDTLLVRTFIIHNNHGKCSITDARQFRLVPRPLTPAVIFTCAGLTKLQNALRINACGRDGNIIILAI